ncbi:Unknown protein sequence [Pseudomonas syringae pv. aceris]|nr:Unknown protein sequence [Pseudomonas syringae pv. aceris]
MVVLLRGLAGGVLGGGQRVIGLFGLSHCIQSQFDQIRWIYNRNAWHYCVGRRQGGGQHERAQRTPNRVFFHDETSISFCS